MSNVVLMEKEPEGFQKVRRVWLTSRPKCPKFSNRNIRKDGSCKAEGRLCDCLPAILALRRKIRKGELGYAKMC
jgi:hypothetical protein